MEEINYLLISLATFIGTASPGPATLAISGMSMNQGRGHGLALATGVLTGSLFWSFSAAFGLAALMYANAWLMETFRNLGACYLLYLSYKSVRSALSVRKAVVDINAISGCKLVYIRGLLIHLSNPKALLFFGSLYTLGLPKEVNTIDLIKVIATIGLTSSGIFIGYALLFSIPKIRHVYIKSRRVFESTFAVFFGVAGVKILANKLSS
ncbi:LysE family translocator [Shewanella glacialimarina]|jgi:threonine efflux protein|uniref:LysE family translocator n=1 Tax=Shewanella glacialimarina TaxID=2590884 RepID=UPI001CF829BA|nr:LysE family translocator [Shewanella glacialimarina]UCX05746.1 LysE family translocator [Shewanella glacialimarina]